MDMFDKLHVESIQASEILADGALFVLRNVNNALAEEADRLKNKKPPSPSVPGNAAAITSGGEIVPAQPLKVGLLDYWTELVAMELGDGVEGYRRCERERRYNEVKPTVHQ